MHCFLRLSGPPMDWPRSPATRPSGIALPYMLCAVCSDSGDTERAMDFLKRESERRLLGEHVPYPVEAWPEGNQRHLAAESALYCRVFTEGLFGIRPTNFRSFTVLPRLPAGWNTMSLRKVLAFRSKFDIVVTRAGDALRVEVKRDGMKGFVKTQKPGEPMQFTL